MRVDDALVFVPRHLATQAVLIVRSASYTNPTISDEQSLLRCAKLMAMSDFLFECICLIVYSVVVCFFILWEL